MTGLFRPILLSRQDGVLVTALYRAWCEALRHTGIRTPYAPEIPLVGLPLGEPLHCFTERQMSPWTEARLVTMDDCSGQGERSSFAELLDPAGSVLECERKKQPKEQVYVGDVNVEMLFDSGEWLTLISNEVFDEHFSDKIKLLDPDVIPGAYGGEIIQLKGYFESVLSFKNKSVYGKIYVLIKGDSVISWPH
ncbi:hypothetical protein NDU88_001772 [Pleurodeles waltl]|uniref:Uncharacterized protein n=1 Tax=Pleurodeles waltl TaxID=8319 RepID=A0AAV7V8Q5_PLEWA|nr:hypothetical protein NDU88_001772 [Pleurodeles waltl]